LEEIQANTFGKNIIQKLAHLCKDVKSKGLSEISFEDFFILFSENPEQIDFVDLNGRNGIHYAVLNGEIGALKSLAKIKPSCLNAIDYQGQTALSISILEGKNEMANELISLGSDCTIGIQNYGSVLHIASERLCPDLVEKLIQRGADANKEDFNGNFPIHLAFEAFSKSAENAKKCLELLMAAHSFPN